MAITVRDDSVLIDSNNKPFKFLRDADYSPAPILVGVNGDSQLPLQCTSEGKLRIDASISVGDIDIGTVEIRAKDEFGVNQFLQVVTDPITSRYALLAEDPRFTFTGNSLNVIVNNTPSPKSPLNNYGTASVLSNSPTTIASYTVPVGKSLDLNSFVVWGDVDGLWKVSVDGTPVGGTRTSPSKLSDSVVYSIGIPVPSNSTVAVSVTQYSGSSVNMYCNIMGVIS